jgi:hypothetical protein
MKHTGLGIDDIVTLPAARSSNTIGTTSACFLDAVPGWWKMIETVREKSTCRDCEAITQPPAPPFHAAPRGFIGPKLLAMMPFGKFDAGRRVPFCGFRGKSPAIPR